MVRDGPGQFENLFPFLPFSTFHIAFIGTSHYLWSTVNGMAGYIKANIVGMFFNAVDGRLMEIIEGSSNIS